MAKPAIFLDRDGVIAESRRGPRRSSPPTSADDLEIPAGASAALHTLRASGYVLVVVTNQPDVARGTKTRAEVDAVNALLLDALPLDAVYVCFHDGDGCACRKPRPGMLFDAVRDLDLDLERSWLIGDRWVDIGAAAAAEVRSVLIERSYSWEPTSRGVPPQDLQPNHTVRDLAEAAVVIVQSSLR